MNRVKTKLITFALLCTLTAVYAGQHPGLFLTPNGVKEIKLCMGKYTAFDKSVAELRQMADGALLSKIDV